ncbi:hypothetical protein [Gilvibacter sp.]|uniref:hypothetical protein n=1 Tax=Gilvibacter sp. TaxID=2729997 RepID=UPI003F49FE98
MKRNLTPISKEEFMDAWEKGENFLEREFDFAPFEENLTARDSIFSFCSFKLDTNLSKIALFEEHRIHLNECEFYGLRITDTDVKLAISISLPEFIHDDLYTYVYTISSCTFQSGLNITLENGGQLDVQNCNFPTPCHFNIQTMNDYDRLNIRGCTFSSLVQIEAYENQLNRKSNSIITVQDCNFSKNVIFAVSGWPSLEIKRSNFNAMFDLKCRRNDLQAFNLNITDVTFKSLCSIECSNFNEIILSNVIFNDPLHFIYDKIKISNSLTCKTLKQQFLRKNDYINSLEFHQREMNSVLAEKRDSKKYADYMVLFLSQLSNNFGTDWIRGVFFTIGMAIILFPIFIVLASPNLEFGASFSGVNYAIDNYLSEFWIFFNPAHKLSSFQGLEIGFWAGAIDFLGRISIVFGSYQTAQAFRKFGRK